MVELLKGLLSLEGLMWSGPKGSTRLLWFGYMALAIMDQGNSHDYTSFSPFCEFLSGSFFFFFSFFLSVKSKNFYLDLVSIVLELHSSN